ncbi:B12-binding domain-containing radical SAM protein [Leadbettera azotonutricia]|uniref:Radical SAM domain protein n=1 Tax=Leadbettera azotonutricia (strain ATCC BAA-888 / DSM 13862 / ZAS-9) TaxID=545695 RepID=F5YER9_LEAAZ|nr:B12-binding domain-containing radical SAM protein [Leadbettera azotonutricia]AEF82717.1 radical SAM domain protein [Leadbettera azotonutricia ZAS-9]
MEKDSAPIVLAAAHLEHCPEAVPLGAASVAACLKARGFSVVLVEGFVADGSVPLVEKILSLNPRAVGFSLYSWNRSIMLEAARAISAKNPDMFLFCGGPEATALSDGLNLKQGGPFDSVIKGEGEEEAVRILGEKFHVEQIPQSVSYVPFGEDLSLLPSPYLEGILEPGEGVLWELTRGCPYACAYCFESKGDRRVRRFSEDRVRKELSFFILKKVSYVNVLDPTFNSDNDRAIHLLDMIIEECRSSSHAVGIHWHFEARAELITRAQARRFASLGASLQIGLQTSDPEVSAKIGRVLDARRFCSRIDILNEEGVTFGLDLIYGLPGDTPEGYRKSLDFAVSLSPNNLDIFRLSVLPGTRLWDWGEQLGLKWNSNAPYGVIETSTFTAAALEMAEKLSMAADVFYNRGRAVAWFNQVLKPLRMKASDFFAKFAARTEGLNIKDSLEIEKSQLDFLENQYRNKKKAELLPAVKDLVQYHGAWGRALAEGKTTQLSFNYDPDLILGEAALDLEAFVSSAKKHPQRIEVDPRNL